MKGSKVSVLLPLLLLSLISANQVTAQSLIAGDITGRITDPSGAVVADATVNLANLDTGVTYQTTTSSDGTFRFSLLKPGRYAVSTIVIGFSAISTTVTVAVGQTTTADLKLQLAPTAIETIVALPLTNSDPGISTSFGPEEVALLPSPGGDLTNIAFTTPGALINVVGAGGSGNFTLNGLPATSNLFTVNGENNIDPFFNINSSGASNLTLGANEVLEATVTTNSYGGQYGTLIGSQINYVTKSGTNDFHGNAQYWWNGRYLNANDFFLNAQKTQRPFANSNQWAASIGGPIVKNNLFFFVNTEGLRFAFPVLGFVSGPTPAFATAVLNNISARAPAEHSTYQKLFQLYASAPGSSAARQLPCTMTPQACSGFEMLRLPGWVPGTPVAQNYEATRTSFGREWLVSARADYVMTRKDNVSFRYRLDRGTQPTAVDLISPNFDAHSDQPQYDGQLIWSHVFSPTITNSFIAAGHHYHAVFAQNHDLAISTFPTNIFYNSNSLPFTGFNPVDMFPNGRNITQYQFIDDLSWNRGKNSWKFGINFRRYDVNDFSFSNTSPAVLFDDLFRQVNPEFTAVNLFANGLASQYFQAINSTTNVPIALWGLGFYGQDQIRLKSNLTLTLALRAERTSNPVCQHDCFSNFTGPFNTLASVTAGANAGNIPYSSDIRYNQHQAFPDVDALDLSPRVAFSWAPGASDHFPWFTGNGKTVISGGYGLFYDSLPIIPVEAGLLNIPISVPLDVLFQRPWDPNGAPAMFKAGAAAFDITQSFNAISQKLQNLGLFFFQPRFTSIVGTLHSPVAQEYNLMVQQQVGKHTAVSVGYIGNRVTRLPYSNRWPNAFDPLRIYPGTSPKPAVPNYSTVNQIRSGAISNYNSLNVTVREQIGTQLFVHFNYTYAHNLDEVSNGGLLNYGNGILSQINPTSFRANNYGNSDYDIRHNLSADYVYTPSVKFHNEFLNLLLGGWQSSGKVYWRTGLPFSVFDGNSFGVLGNAFGIPQLAQPIGVGQQSSCGKSNNFTTRNSCLNPNAFINSGANNFTGYTVFPTQTRNQYRGPGYFNMDMALYKNFRVRERGNLALGMNAYNVFNHPNFANPDSILGSATFGQILNTVSVPTSPYGFGLGFHSSIRVAQFTAKITF